MASPNVSIRRSSSVELNKTEHNIGVKNLGMMSLIKTGIPENENRNVANNRKQRNDEIMGEGAWGFSLELVRLVMLGVEMM